MDNQVSTFIFKEPQRALGWEPKDKDIEYERQYNDWVKRNQLALEQNGGQGNV